MGIIANAFRFGRKKSYQAATGGNCVYSGTKESFIDYLLGRGQGQLAARQTISYYSRCAPLSDAVDRIAQELASLTPIVKNEKTGEIMPNHPALKLLAFPNADSTWDEFMTAISSFFVITGEYFSVLSGAIGRPPVAIYPASPAIVTVTAGPDGYAEIMTLADNYTGETFERSPEAEMNERRFKFYNQTNDQELTQTKNFNPRSGLSSLRGASVLNSLYYDIEQCINAGIHNLSMLARGGTPSGLLSTDQEMSTLSDDQREKLKEQVNNYLAGSENAGRMMFFDKGIKYQQMSQTNRDMNFVELKLAVERSIYNRFKIPLPLVSTDSMAEANVENGRMLFYDNTIIPLANRIFAELTLALMYRYPNNDDLIITYDIGSIPALEPRRNAELVKKKESGVFSTNEIRNEFGELPATGGDDVLGASNLIPIARVTAESE